MTCILQVVNPIQTDNPRPLAMIPVVRQTARPFYCLSESYEMNPLQECLLNLQKENKRRQCTHYIYTPRYYCNETVNVCMCRSVDLLSRCNILRRVINITNALIMVKGRLIWLNNFLMHMPVFWRNGWIQSWQLEHDIATYLELLRWGGGRYWVSNLEDTR